MEKCLNVVDVIDMQLRPFFKDERGASSVEYALVAGFIAVVIVAALVATGFNLNGLYGRVKDKVVCVVNQNC